MEVILLESIRNLGELGDLVKVKPGYARNYLIPGGKAVFASEEAKEKVEARRRELAKMEAERLDTAKARLSLLGARISVSRKAGEEGKLFGSVSASDVAEALSNDDITVQRSEIALPDGPLKELGEFEVQVILHPEVQTTVAVEVIAEE